MQESLVTLDRRLCLPRELKTTTTSSCCSWVWRQGRSLRTRPHYASQHQTKHPADTSPSDKASSWHLTIRQSIQLTPHHQTKHPADTSPSDKTSSWHLSIRQSIQLTPHHQTKHPADTSPSDKASSWHLSIRQSIQLTPQHQTKCLSANIFHLHKTPLTPVKASSWHL